MNHYLVVCGVMLVGLWQSALGEPVVVDTLESKRRQSIHADARKFLMEGNFEELDKLADQLRASKEMYFHGTWALNSFYLGASAISIDTPEPDCAVMLEKVNAWVKAKPKSVTASVALANAWASYAWKARGKGWADTVSETGAQLMQERLAESWKALEAGKRLDARCSHWWYIATTVAQGQGWEKERFFSMIEAGIAFEPTYYDLYSGAALLLEPRWYGKEGEVEDFFEKYAAKREGAEADVFYARMVWLLDLRRLDKTIFESHPRLSWQRVVAGFEELLKRHPDSLSVKSEFARLAYKAKDKPRARSLFKEIGMNLDKRVWLTPSTFMQYRNWAFEP